MQFAEAFDNFGAIGSRRNAVSTFMPEMPAKRRMKTECRVNG
jgi:hypothetical protein